MSSEQRRMMETRLTTGPLRCIFLLMQQMIILHFVHVLYHVFTLTMYN